MRKFKLCIDSGASDHVFPPEIASHPDAFLYEVKEGINVENAFGKTERFTSMVNIGFATDGIVVPGASVGLLSACKMVRETGCNIEIDSEGNMEISKNGVGIHYIQPTDNTYSVEVDILFDDNLRSGPVGAGGVIPDEEARAFAGRRPRPLTQAQQEKVKELHVITGHQSQERMCAGVNSGAWVTEVTCYEINKVMANWTCLTCARTKYTAIPTGLGSGVRPENPGEMVASDFVPVTPVSCFGHIGYFLFRDVASDYEWPYIVKSKEQFLEGLEAFLLMLNQNRHAMIKLRTDSEAVLNSKAVRQFLADKGVQKQSSPPYEQQRNPAERGVQENLKDVAAIMLGQQSFEWPMWVFAVMAACQLHNLTPSGIHNFEKSPEAILTGLKPPKLIAYPGQAVVVRLRPKARKLPMIPNETKKERQRRMKELEKQSAATDSEYFTLGPNAETGIYVRPDMPTKSHLIWVPSKGKLVTRLQVKPLQLTAQEYKEKINPMMRRLYSLDENNSTSSILQGKEAVEDAINGSPQTQALERQAEQDQDQDEAEGQEILELGLPLRVDREEEAVKMKRTGTDKDYARMITGHGNIEMPVNTAKEGEVVVEEERAEPHFSIRIEVPPTEEEQKGMQETTNEHTESLKKAIASGSATGDNTVHGILGDLVKSYVTEVPVSDPIEGTKNEEEKLSEEQLESGDEEDVHCAEMPDMTTHEKPRLKKPGRKKRKRSPGEKGDGGSSIDTERGKRKRERRKKAFLDEDEYNSDDAKEDERGPKKKKRKLPKKAKEALKRILGVRKTSKVLNILGELHDATPSLKKALGGKDKDQWLQAIKEELDNMKAQQVYDEVEVKDVPEGAEIVHSTMQLLIKTSPLGEIIKWKARLCARGDQESVDAIYKDLYAPTASTKTFKFLMNLGAKFGMHKAGCDIKGAFLYADLDKPIYMYLPKELWQEGVPVVWKLKKSIYGLKEAPKLFYDHITGVLKDKGYKQTGSDPCCFHRWYNDEQAIFFVIHVDDAAIVASKTEYIDQLYKDLRETYEITEDRGLHSHTGIHIEQKDKSIKLQQPAYIQALFDEFLTKERKGAAPSQTPSTALPKSGNGVDEPKRCDKNKYLRLLGKLVFIPERSRPDIGFAVSYGSSRNANPTEEDWERLIRIVAYLQHTKDMALTYRQDPRARGDGTINKELVKVVAYCDASYNLYEDGKSQSGYVIAFPTGDNAEDKAAVHARSFKQGRITLSSTESELEAVFELVKEIQ